MQHYKQNVTHTVNVGEPFCACRQHLTHIRTGVHFTRIRTRRKARVRWWTLKESKSHSREYKWPTEAQAALRDGETVQQTNRDGVISHQRRYDKPTEKGQKANRDRATNQQRRGKRPTEAVQQTNRDGATNQQRRCNKPTEKGQKANRDGATNQQRRCNKHKHRRSINTTPAPVTDRQCKQATHSPAKQFRAVLYGKQIIVSMHYSIFCVI